MKVITWTPTTLSEQCDLLPGFAFQSKLFTDDTEDIVLIKGENLGKGEVLWNKSKYWPRSDTRAYAKFRLETDDVLLAMDRPIVGGRLKYAWIRAEDPPSFLVQRVARLRGINQLNTRYLRYLIASPQFQGYVDSIITGANVPHISGRDILKFNFILPPEPVQHRIVGFLSVFDDLIENNRRRISLLEEAVQQLYKDWFVHLRYPDHETTKLIDGVPDGWHTAKLGEICQCVGGGTPSTTQSEYWEYGDITWITPSDITKNDCLILLDSEKKITPAGLKGSSSKLVPPDTILMTSRASVGFFGLIDREVCTNQGFISIIPSRENLRMYLLQNLISRVDEIRANAGGATYLEINKSRFRELPILVPNDGLLDQFQSAAYEMIRFMRILKNQKEKLVEARAFLLPRVLGGEIEV